MKKIYITTLHNWDNDNFEFLKGFLIKTNAIKYLESLQPKFKWSNELKYYSPTSNLVYEIKEIDFE